MGLVPCVVGGGRGPHYVIRSLKAALGVLGGSELARVDALEDPAELLPRLTRVIVTDLG